jgi:F-type H+-transporting ATPase subunit epsilon
MFVEIVSPETTLFKGEVESLYVPGINGEFQMLNNHAAIVSLLGKGQVKLIGQNLSFDETNVNKFEKLDARTFGISINSGTLEFNNNKAIVLAD